MITIIIWYLFIVGFILFLIVELFNITNRKFLKFVAVIMLIPITFSLGSLLIPTVAIKLGELFELLGTTF